MLENNGRLNSDIVKRMKAKGYAIDSFKDGKEAYRMIDEGYACFILEMHTPSLNGIEVLRKIRDYYPETPVVMMNVHGDVELKIVKDAYNYGCSDFIKRPFSMEELEIKIEKLCNIRRDIVQLNAQCYFDFKASILKIGSMEKRFSRKESLLLSVLISEKGSVASFEKIKAIVWEGNVVSLESVRSLIRRVRKKLPDKSIETIVDTGYILRTDALIE